MKKISISIITILIFCMVFTVNLNAAMIANESNGAYCGGSTGNSCPPDPPKTSSTSSSNEGYVGPTIRDLIVEGGGYLLQSSSDINDFFNKIELSELSRPDYETLQTSLNAAIYNIEKARDTYYHLKTLAGVTPYNQDVIYMLISFDYDTFSEEKGLFPYVFSKVKKLLSVGDVTGVYNELYSYTSQIMDLLYTIKRYVDAGIFPKLSIVWGVNQKYSEVKLFGQYVARVFYSINQ